MRSRIFAIVGIPVAASLLLVVVQISSARADEGSVAYPDGYRKWTFLHSSIVPPGISGFSQSPCVKPCTNGIFHFYANEQAMQGLRTGTYEDGAVIAMELLEFRLGDKGYGEEGRRVRTAVMAKDSSRYANTSGWGFGRFDEGSKRIPSTPKPSRRAISATRPARITVTFSRNTPIADRFSVIDR